MLSYRHLFHAGNFADVFKHALLSRLLIALGNKAKPYCYLDTHAGTGRYDLLHPWAQKAREFENGIGRIWSRKDIPVLLSPYMDAVHAENPDGRLRFYPGSPRIAMRLRRPGDRLVFAELNKTDCGALQTLLAHDRNVTVQLMDGYQALQAFLPPKEKRGLILIDSSFDRAREFDRIAKALRSAHARFATGVYAVWYPLMGAGVVRDFARSVERSGIRKILRLEITVAPEESPYIAGCGLLVINPPWKFESDARALLDWLWHTLATDGAGGVTIDWLVPE